MSDLVLRLVDLTKRYGDFTAVQGLSLAVPRGSVYGFLGPNGAGKTTTIRMTLGIYEATSGSIEILGASSALDVRHRIGYLPEEKGLYKKMKARDLVTYFGQLKGMRRSDARAKATELLDRYGLGEFKDRKCEAMSKGMGQKVQVLASIVHSPEFVILDEPFSGLDPVNQQVMEQVIADMAKGGATIIFSTHVMEHAERLCNRVVLIAKGQKKFDGTIEEARAALPRRILITTRGEPHVLRTVPGVTGIVAGAAAGTWEVTLDKGASAETVLQACFKNGVDLSSFDKREPGLRDLFLKLVGAEDAAEEVAA